VFGGDSDFSSTIDVLDPAGALFDDAGWMPDWYGDGKENLTNWANNVSDFDQSAIGGMWDKLRKDPTQLLLGAGDPFSAKVWNKAIGTDYTPYVNQWGGPTKEAYQDAANQGIDTSDAQGAHGIAQLLAAYFGTAGAGAAFGAAGNAAGIGAAGGQAVGGAAMGAGNAWANGGDVFQSALTGALPGLSQLFGGAMNGVNSGTMGDQLYQAEMGVATQPTMLQQAGQAVANPAQALGVTNQTAQGALNSGLRGAATSGVKGDSMGEGFLQGGLGNLLGQGLSALGTTNAQGQSLGNSLASAGMGMYAANQAKKDINGQIGQLQSLFSGNSPYAQQLRQQLNRKDAAGGRRSQYGPREVELQARLAELNSKNAPQLNSLYNQRSGANMSQYKDMYNLLRSSGVLGSLGDAAKQYFQGYGNQNPNGDFTGPPVGLSNLYQNNQTWNNDEVQY